MTTFIILWTFTAIFLALGQVFGAATRWHTRQSRLYATDFDAACVKAKNPPWYVRWTDRLPGG